MPIPVEWATSNTPPTIYERGVDWDQLRGRYDVLGDSRPLDEVFSLVERNGVTHAIQEHDYIDADYRDEFANFYASTYPPFPDRCERLHFLDRNQQRYLGYTVIRPVPERPVCRTMLAPPADLKDFVSCITTSRATPHGQPMRAPASRSSGKTVSTVSARTPRFG